MSSSILPTPSTADTHGGGCAHCDGSVPHEHVDVRAELTASARRSRTRSAIVTSLAVLPLAVGLILAITAGDAGSAVVLALAVAVGWVAATAVGVLVTKQAGRRSPRLGLAAGAATTAALGPVVGLAAGLWTGLGGGHPWAAALVAGGAWWTASAVVDLLAARAWRRSLFEPGEAAERARVQAMAGREDRTVVTLAWLVQGPAVAVAAVLSGAPALAVVLLAALCATLSVRGAARRA